jgi:hypothetical protein
MNSRSGPDRRPSLKIHKTVPPAATDSTSHPALAPILAALRGLQLGSVEIIVHEGRITYIERREQQRVSLALAPPEPAGGADCRKP